MKQGKRPTYDQKRLIAKKGLDWRSYQVREETEDALILIDKGNGEVKRIQLPIG